MDDYVGKYSMLGSKIICYIVNMQLKLGNQWMFMLETTRCFGRKLLAKQVGNYQISGATRGGGDPSSVPPAAYFAPPHSTPALALLSTIFYKILSIKKEIPTFFFGASRISSNRISNHFLVFDARKDSRILNYPLTKPYILLLTMSITIHIPLKVTQNLAN